MRYTVDSYAWLDYFMGTAAGEKVKPILESPSFEKFTPSICVSEVYAKVLRVEGLEKAEVYREFMRATTAIVSLDENLAVEAAKIDVEMKKNIPSWGLADSIVLATTRNKRARVLTGDEHFRNLPETIWIEG